MRFLSNQRPTRRNQTNKTFLNQNAFVPILHLPIAQAIVKINEYSSAQENYQIKQEKEKQRIKQEKSNAFTQAKKSVMIDIKECNLGFRIYMNGVYFKSQTVVHFMIDCFSYICTRNKGVQEVSYSVNNFAFIASTMDDLISLTFEDRDVRTKKVIVKCPRYEKELVPETLIERRQNSTLLS